MLGSLVYKPAQGVRLSCTQLDRLTASGTASPDGSNACDPHRRVGPLPPQVALRIRLHLHRIGWSPSQLAPFHARIEGMLPPISQVMAEENKWAALGVRPTASLSSELAELELHLPPLSPKTTIDDGRSGIDGNAQRVSARHPRTDSQSSQPGVGRGVRLENSYQSLLDVRESDGNSSIPTLGRQAARRKRPTNGADRASSRETGFEKASASEEIFERKGWNTMDGSWRAL